MLRLFANRIEAGIRLAAKLKQFADPDNTIVLGIPRGGVPVAAQVARILQVPFDIVLTKKLGHPFNKEYAIGAVGLENRFVIPHEDVSAEYIEAETQRVRERLRQMQALYKGNSPMQPIAGKTVIVVDDGIATGNTLIVTVKMLRSQHPAAIIVAAPVSSEQAYAKLKAEADDCICVHVSDSFTGVGAWYDDFSQVEDEEVIALVQEMAGDNQH